jgi:DNA-binding NarL/FixJ family response regulator
LKKLEEICSTDKQRMYLDLINSDINNITSSFPIKLSSKYLKLTTSELNIANLVKHGKRTKEIAELLNVSCQTIDSHRNSIRKKLGIRNKKVDLRTYLLSM